MVTKLSNIDMSDSKYDLNVDLHFLTHLINDSVIILCQQEVTGRDMQPIYPWDDALHHLLPIYQIISLEPFSLK